jgi:hypothetical protein
VRCSSCNEPTRVIDSRPRDDGAIRRRRECVACGHRFTTEEWDRDAADRFIGEVPEIGYGISGPLEAVRRRAILSSKMAENERELAAAQERILEIQQEQIALLQGVLARHETEVTK